MKFKSEEDKVKEKIRKELGFKKKEPNAVCFICKKPMFSLSGRNGICRGCEK